MSTADNGNTREMQTVNKGKIDAQELVQLLKMLPKPSPSLKTVFEWCPSHSPLQNV